MVRSTTALALVAAALSVTAAHRNPTASNRTLEASDVGVQDLPKSVAIDTLYHAALADVIYVGSKKNEIEADDGFPKSWKQMDHQVEVYNGNNDKGRFMIVGVSNPATSMKNLYVVFKGTQFGKIQDIVADALAGKPADFRQHKKLAALGFVDMYEHMDYSMGAQFKLPDRVRKISKEGGYTRTIIIGHSLGGALANLLYADLMLDGRGIVDIPQDLELVTFGSPRVFQTEMADKLQLTCKNRCRRFLSHGDPVPHLPTAKTGFKHFGNVRYINKAGKNKWEWALQKDQDFSAEVGDPRNHGMGKYISRLLSCTDLKFGKDAAAKFRADYKAPVEATDI